MKKLLFFFLGIFITTFIQAQDTLTLLQYNLLNYGNNTSYCNSNNNNLADKDQYIKTIVHYINPDVFTVNEMGGSPAMQQRLLDHALNTDAITWYRKADYTPPSDYLVNMLYYNSKKLRYYSHVTAQSYIRDIDIYKLYYYSQDLKQGDTIFINCIVAHLKAGAGTENSNKRKIMAQNLMTFLAAHSHEMNYLLMGDFNAYTFAGEPAMNLFINNANTDIRFHDPIDRMGPWHNNNNYSDIHTQSTHASSNGCAASGGMDDRFDYILISNDVKNVTHKVSYISGTYRAVGQDGKHFNKSINASPANTSVPADVLNALYHNSDHLPVTLKLKVDKTLGINEWKNTAFNDIRFANPVHNHLTLSVDAFRNSMLEVQIISLTGKVIVTKELPVIKGDNTFQITVGYLPKGLYILKFSDEKGKVTVKKMMKV